LVKILSRKVENIVDQVHQEVTISQRWLNVLLREDFRDALERNRGEVE